ncbi:MAG: hypothetical protein IJH95_03940 [Mogibacterium sp.]|nr:hypothetical protein [Mogibacterium sp.]
MKETVYEILSGEKVCGEYSDGKLHIVDEKLAPLYLKDFRAWVASRAIASSRGLTSRNIKAASGLSANEYDFETAMKAHAACVADNYWVREKGSELRYEDVSFDGYTGYFSRLALGLDYSWSDYVSDDPNPELTNIGNSDKSWQTDEFGTRWLYKKQPLNECYNEVLASKLAKKLGIDTVDYELVYASEPDPELGRYGIVRSTDFMQNRDLNFEPAELILKHLGTRDSDIEANADYFNELGLVKPYLNIIYLDIISGNPDRHSFNYGVLRDRSTGAVVGMAPNFDNNFAFFAGSMPTEQFIRAAKKYDWRAPCEVADSATASENALTETFLAELAAEMKSIAAFGSYDNPGAIRSIKTRNDQLFTELKELKI